MKIVWNLALLGALFLWPTGLVAEGVSDDLRIESIQGDIDRLMAKRSQLAGEIAAIDEELERLRKTANRLRVQRLEDHGMVVTIARSPAEMRRSKNRKSKVRRVIPQGTTVKVIDFKSSYWKVEFRGASGYISDYRVVQTKAIADYKRFKGQRLEDRGMVVTIVRSGTEAEMRRSKNHKSRVQRVIPQGTTVKVIDFEPSSHWKVEFRGASGYISDYWVVQTEAVAEYKRLKGGSDATESASAPVRPRRSSGGSAVKRPPLRSSCCRICRKGKACGDSCISITKTCRKPLGCACNG